MRKTVRGLLLLILAVAVPAIASGPLEPGGPPEIPIQVLPSQDAVTPGGAMRIAVVYQVPANHHIQVNEFLFAAAAEGESFRLENQVLPPTRIWEEEPVLDGNVTVLYTLVSAPGITPGERSLNLTAGYQACSETPVFACFAPEERTITLRLRVAAPGTSIHPMHAGLFPKDQAGGSGPAPPTQVADQGQTGAPTRGPSKPQETGGGTNLQENLAAKLRSALARGSWLAFLLVFVAGFLSSFTPCVYPMIPITIGYVAGASRGRLSGFVLSLFFVLGIAIVYSVLGTVAALSGGVFGAALQSRPALIVIALVFGLMGASMLGAYDLNLPSGFQTRLQSGRRSGWIGAVMMGGITGLVASPCVGPVLVVLLTWVAQVARPLYGFGLLFTFAVGLGVLFIVLGSFVGAIQSLPRAGAWMETVKHYFGWIFLALTIFYLRTVIGATWAAILYGALLILLATQIGAFSPLSTESEKGMKWRKGIGIVILVFGVAVMMNGLLTHFGWRGTLAARGPTAGEAATAASGVDWRSDERSALAEARTSGRPVLLDFTADWCAACHELDRETWSHPDVKKELERFVTLRLDMTRRTPETAELTARWKIAGLPTVIVLDGRGEEVDRFFGFRSAGQVLPLLRQAV